MKLPKTILRGYDRVTEKIVAQALGITLPKKKKKGGDRRMKIPMSALKKNTAGGKGKSKKSGIKFGAIKGKQVKDTDKDGE